MYVNIHTKNILRTLHHVQKKVAIVGFRCTKVVRYSRMILFYSLESFRIFTKSRFHCTYTGWRLPGPRVCRVRGPVRADRDAGGGQEASPPSRCKWGGESEKEKGEEKKHTGEQTELPKCIFGGCWDLSDFMMTTFMDSMSLSSWSFQVRTKDGAFDSASHLISFHRDNELPIVSAESAITLRRAVSRRERK